MTRGRPRAAVVVALLVLVLVGCGTATETSSTAGSVGSTAGSIGSASTTTAAPGSTTTSLPGRELFRHATPDGRVVLVGRVVQHDEVCPSPRGTIYYCNGDGPLLFIDQDVDGRFLAGDGGAAMPHGTPTGPVVGGSQSSGPYAYATLYTGPEVAKVTMELRQADGTVVTDTMAPVEGVVAFASPLGGKLLGPAKAYDAAGTVLVTKVIVAD